METRERVMDDRSLKPAPGERLVLRGPQPFGRSGVLCSMATGDHRELLAETAVTMAAYGRRHGWDVLLSCENLASGRPAAWSKVPLVQELLTGYDFVFWIDADAIIVDLDRYVLDEVSDDADIWFAWHSQDRDPNAAVVNTGVFLARSTPFTVGLFDEVWRSEAFINHNWWENAAMINLLGCSLEPPYERVRESAWDDRIGKLDLAWNSVPGYCESPDPVINHHARANRREFGRRLASMSADRKATVAAYPADFHQARSSMIPVLGRLLGRH